MTPGVFAEYTYTYKDKVTLLVGVREDYSTRYGFFTTPRMNLRDAPFEWWTLRGSVGLGYRTPNAIEKVIIVWYNDLNSIKSLKSAKRKKGHDGKNQILSG